MDARANRTLTRRHVAQHDPKQIRPCPFRNDAGPPHPNSKLASGGRRGPFPPRKLTRRSGAKEVPSVGTFDSGEGWRVGAGLSTAGVAHPRAPRRGMQ